MLCPGSWAGAPVPGYIAEGAWWDSPVDSEDEEKPLHTQATAAEKKGETQAHLQNTSILLLVHQHTQQK